jgi:hypothetical protein
MSNSSYDEINLVAIMHQVLHLNPATFATESSTFDVDNSFDLNGSYTKSLLTIPVIIMIISLLCVFMLECFLCWRPCCKCCQFGDDDDEQLAYGVTPSSSRQNLNIGGGVHVQPSRKEKFVPTIRKLYRSFYVVAIMAVITNQLLIFGAVELTSGVITGQDGIDFVGDVFTTLDDLGNELIEEGTIVQTDFLNSLTDCPEASDLYANMNSYFEYVDEYIAVVHPVASQCSNVHDDLQLWGIHYANNAIWEIYGIIMLIIAVYLLGLLWSKKLLLQMFIHFTAALLFLLLILCAVEMVLLVGMADFCVNPNVNLMKIVPDDVYNVTVGSCGIYVIFHEFARCTSGRIIGTKYSCPLRL